jgi:hypothetical protein
MVDNDYVYQSIKDVDFGVTKMVSLSIIKVDDKFSSFVR